MLPTPLGAWLRRLFRIEDVTADIDTTARAGYVERTTRVEEETPARNQGPVRVSPSGETRALDLHRVAGSSSAGATVLAAGILQRHTAVPGVIRWLSHRGAGTWTLRSPALASASEQAAQLAGASMRSTGCCIQTSSQSAPTGASTTKPRTLRPIEQESSRSTSSKRKSYAWFRTNAPRSRSCSCGSEDRSETKRSRAWFVTHEPGCAVQTAGRCSPRTSLRFPADTTIAASLSRGATVRGDALLVLLLPLRTVPSPPLWSSAGVTDHSCDLRWSTLWNRAELLHHCHQVDDSPMLAGETVVIERNDVDQLHIDVLARSGAYP
jgi:hypothetical protein